MRDPNFERAVVLLVQHTNQGALGLVVNREATVKVGDVVTHLELSNPVGTLQRPALWGGPVERGAGFVLYKGLAPEGWTTGNVAVSPSKERLAALIQAGADFHLCLGYAGWGPGQLDRELEEGSWVHVDTASDLIFDTPLPERYDRALARLGVSPELLFMTPISE
jgi:putative transcriptional regulator